MIDTIVEPFGGLGAYSLKAMALEYERSSGRKCRHEPPVSRTGNKAGFAVNVFKAWGLSRNRWRRVWLNDASPVCRLFHLLYSSHELRVEVSRRILAMVPCPDCNPGAIEEALAGMAKPTPESLTGKPGCLLCGWTGTLAARLLWGWIRKEPIHGDVAQMVAGGAALQMSAFSQLSVDPWQDGAHPWGMNREGSISTITFDDRPERESSRHPYVLASRLDSLPCGLASLAEVIARALFMQSRSFSLNPVEIVGVAWDKKGWKTNGFKPEWDDGDYEVRKHPFFQVPRWSLARATDLLPMSHLLIRATWGDAAAVLPEGDASNVLCVLDPPYLGTSGYSHDCPRESVLSIARAWHEAGAQVLIHEAVGLAGELGNGWLERPADVLRGRASTFWGEGGQREWATFNRSPVWWPSQQQALFA